MKYLILIGDGMGDHPIGELGNRTPLEAAKTPAMDKLCQNGALLCAATIPDGFPPGSDVANMSLLGYDPQRYYTGRAPLEAASMGVRLAEDQTAYRCNLVTLDFPTSAEATMVDFSAGHISSEEAAELMQMLQQELGNEDFSFHPGVSYRHLLVVNDRVPTFTGVPPHDYIGKDVTNPWQQYQTAPPWNELVTKAKELLTNHPVNQRRRNEGKRPASAIWPWGEGKMPAMLPLYERFGITGTMISAVDLLKGLGVCSGIDVANVVGATGYIDTNYEGKAQAALDALETQDFVFVHLEAPDEAGHQGRLDHKLTAIEDFDSRIVAPITQTLEQRGESFRAVITMDHFTPLAIQTHTAEPIPVILYDSQDTKNGSQKTFCEANISGVDRASIVPGSQLINLLLQKEG
ncbi:MAG: cofactor-independent phosphoglycerate mutase [Desulfobulbaceae bacterium]|nr:MAG: cofactor-independent phosphoglycerate mutase [Desulfobulbaceae bacterium]